MIRPANIACIILALLSGTAITACRASMPSVDCLTETPIPGKVVACRLPGHPERDFLLQLPDTKPATPAPVPLIVAFHGGGGTKEGFNRLTCPNGDTHDSACFLAAAAAAGHIVAVPDGAANPLGFRSWNQGGKAPGLQCPWACENDIDDLAYVDALLAYLERLAPFDTSRVHAVGFSNGAGLAHRLACQRADRFASIAAVGGANQHARAAVCQPARAIPILQIHGSDDPCWPYAGGEGRCLAAQHGTYASVAETFVGSATTEGWVGRYNASPTPVSHTRQDTDGHRVVIDTWHDGLAPLTAVRIDGAGHTWPGGDPYLAARRIGDVCRTTPATPMILSFFRDPKTVL